MLFELIEIQQQVTGKDYITKPLKPKKDELALKDNKERNYGRCVHRSCRMNICASVKEGEKREMKMVTRIMVRNS